MLVRVSTGCTADVRAAVALLQDMHAEDIGYSDFTQDPEYVASQIHALATSPVGLLLIAEDETGIVGMMLCSVCSPWYTKEHKIATEHVLYVAEHRRGSSAAVRLVRAFIRYAREARCKRILSGVTTSKTALTKRLYSSLGFTSHGQTFKMEL